ncbi:MAG: DUF305 domain-containing protein [Clostridiales bacterium]|nr:DUF305 domain-containing protein [Clostridiales bacterium]
MNNNARRLDRSAVKYLSRYYLILEDMIEGMTTAKLNDSISHNFIVQMIPHHRAAIEMSENLLKYSDFEPLRSIASGIIDEQTKSIADMERIIRRCTAMTNDELEIKQYQRRVNEIIRLMFSEMENAPQSNNINTDFMLEMIPHHRGAIRMSENALKYRICPDLKPILQAIISSQAKGIREMEGLLRKM